MTYWDQDELNRVIDQALSGPNLVASGTETGGKAELAKLRYALYNRAKARGVHSKLTFSISLASAAVLVQQKQFAVLTAKGVQADG